MTRAALGAVVVYERDGAWSRALRRFVPREISVMERVPFEPVEADPQVAPVTLAVVARQQDAQAVLAWARRTLLEDDRALRMAVVRPADQELAWCLRETGIRMIWDEFWQLPALAEMTRRFCRQYPRPDLSVEQRIWNNLPWNHHASETKGRRSNAP